MGSSLSAGAPKARGGAPEARGSTLLLLWLAGIGQRDKKKKASRLRPPLKKGER